MEPAGIYEAVFDAFIPEILLKLCEGSTVAGVSLERNWGRARSWHFKNKTWAGSRLGSSSDLHRLVIGWERVLGSVVLGEHNVYARCQILAMSPPPHDYPLAPACWVAN